MSEANSTSRHGCLWGLGMLGLVLLVIVLFSLVFNGAWSGAEFVLLIFAGAALWRLALKVEAQGQQFDLELQRLTERVYQLEQRGRPAPAAPEVETVVAPIAAAPVSAEAPRRQTPEEQQSWMPARPAIPPPPVVEVPTPWQFPVAPAPEPASGGWRDWLDFENVLGRNWLSKLGIAVLVIGVAFLLAWQVRSFGPRGRDATGLLVSVVLLALGAWGEAKASYRLPARAGLSGGWALLYFTAYAAHFVPAARIVASPITGLGLMLAVAAAMVAHTLRYQSQTVTGLAFALAFATIGLNQAGIYGLSANLVLVVALCVVTGRRQWFALQLAGIVAAYASHAFWLRPILAARHGGGDFAGAGASTVVLLGTWAAFRLTYLAWPAAARGLAVATGLANTGLLLAVLKYQAARPEMTFPLLLGLGATEFTLALVARKRGHRTSFSVLATLGAALMVAAFPFRYAPGYVTPLWLAEAEILFFAGVLTAERLFRRLGEVAAAATGLQLVSIRLRHAAEVLQGQHLGRHDARLAAVSGMTALALFANAHWARRRWSNAFAAQASEAEGWRGFDQAAGPGLSILAGLVAVAAAWVTMPGDGAAVAWITLGVGLAWVGRRLDSRLLCAEANLVAATALIRAVVVNLNSRAVAWPHALHLDNRVLTLAAVAAGLYLMARWNRHAGLEMTRRMPEAATAAASLLLGLLAWYELQPLSVAAGWALLGLILFETGARRRWRALELEGYAALLAAFGRIFMVNLNAVSWSGGLDPKLFSVVPIVLALAYIHDRLQRRGREPGWAMLPAWLALVAMLALLRFTTPPDDVAVTWAALVPLLMAAAWRAQRPGYVALAEVAALLTLLRGVLHDLVQRSYFPWPARLQPWMHLGAAVALLAAALPLAYRLRRGGRTGSANASVWQRLAAWCTMHAELALFYPPLLLVSALLAAQLRRGLLTVGWGLEGVIVFLLGLAVRDRCYRLSGLGLLLLCVGKIFLVDIWSLGLRDKALTGIVVGLALLGVSILYNRNQEAVRRWL